MTGFFPSNEGFSSKTKHAPFVNAEHFFALRATNNSLWKSMLKTYGPPPELGSKEDWLTPKGYLKKGLSGSSGLIPCVYGGSELCAKHGGDGATSHKMGYIHKFPHASELGGGSEPAPGQAPLQSKKLLGPSVAPPPPPAPAPAPNAEPLPEIAAPPEPAPMKESLLGTPHVDPKQLAYLGTKTKTPGYGQLVQYGSQTLPFVGMTVNNHVILKEGSSYKCVAQSDTFFKNPEEKAQHTPWSGADASTVVKSPSYVSKAMKDVLQKQASEHCGTHQSYVDAFHKQGYHAFIVGGIVRDLITSKGSQLSKDVDIVSDAPYPTVRQVAAKDGQLFNDWLPIALCQTGSKHDSAHALDLTCLRASDQFSTGPQTGTGGGVKLCGTLATDCSSRDFACNALFYDPHNDVIHDPTGRGLADAQNKMLSPSYVTPEGRETWLANPRLGIRTVKMLMRGFKMSDALKKDLTPAVFDKQMKQFIQEKNLKSVAAWVVRQTCADLTNEQSWGDLNGTTRKKVLERLKQFKQTMSDAGFGSTYDKYLGPALMDLTGHPLNY